MSGFIIRRLIYALVVMVIASMFVFGLSRAAGDPRLLYLSEYTTKAEWDAWGRDMGLDKPLVAQYFTWISKAVRGDFGRSLLEQKNAMEVIASRMAATFKLAGTAFAFSILIGFPLGVLSAIQRGSTVDHAARIFALFGQALPTFWLGIVLILIFAVELHWLPTGRQGGWKHLILPALTLGWANAAAVVRLVRSSMLDVLDSEFIKLARAKGVSRTSLVWKHAMRNALIPPLTYVGLLFAGFLTGAVVTETVFAWPGLGRLSVQAVFNNDFSVLTGIVMIFTAMYAFANLMVDLLYAVIDPRIKFT